MRHISTIALLLASIFCAHAQSNIAQRVLPKLKQSVLTVYAENEDGYNFSRGSGFFISSSGIGVTNYHVLDGAYSGYVKDSKGQTYRIKGIVDYSPAMDLVKFSVEKSQNQKITPLIVSQNSPRQGEEIISYSTPLGVFENTVSTGIVSSIRNMQGYGSVIQITAPISHGMPTLSVHSMDIGMI
jgi:serine protease Do